MVDKKSRCLTIGPLPGSCGVARGGRVIPMDYETEVILNRFKIKNGHFGEGYVFAGDDGMPLDVEHLKRCLQQAAHDAGIERSITFNFLRNTFALRMLEKGVTLTDLYRLLGLSDIAKVMRYAGFARDVSQL